MTMTFQRYFRTIAIVFILAITGLSVLLYHTYNKAVSLVKEQSNEQQMLVARQTAIGIEKNIRFLVKELELLSRMTAIKSMNTEEARPTMEQVFEYAKTLHVNDIALIDAKGINRLPLMAPHLKGKDFSHREYFKKASKLEVSSPTYQFITFKGADIGQKGIIIAMPIFIDDEEFGGVVLFTIKVNELIKGFAPLQSTNNKFWAIDRYGNTLYHSEYKPGTNINKIPNLDTSFKTFLKNIEAGMANNAEYISPQGIKTISASYPIKIADQTWSMVISAPERTVRKLLASFSAGYGLISLIVLLVIGGASFSIIRLISRWNLELASTVHVKTKELALSKERLRGLVETVNDLIWEVDENGKYVYVSPRVKDILGYEPDQLIGKTIFDSMLKDEPQKAKSVFQQMAAKKEPFSNLENAHLHKNGKLVILETSGTPILDVKGNLSGYRGVDRDITERVRSEEALRKSEEETRSIGMELALGLSEVFEALKQISSGDPEVRIPEVSEIELIGKLKHMVNLTAQNLAEIVNLSHEFAIGLAEHFDVLHRVSKGGLGARVTGTSQVELLEYLKKVTNQMIESVSREMTERKRAEGELRKHRDHLEDLVKARTGELITANEQLQQEIVERKRAEEERERLISELRDALAEVKALSGLLPICSSCKNIRDDKGYWNQIEAYIKDHSEAEFSHSICPECTKKLYPEFWEKRNRNKEGT